jgi:osmotically-inducible protein OsmY
LKRSAESEGRNIQVSVYGDKAVLTGNVHSFSELEDARYAAYMAPGIMSVQNDIIIAQ